MEFFLDPFWKGPKPKAGTILRVCPMGGEVIVVRVPSWIPALMAWQQTAKRKPQGTKDLMTLDSIDPDSRRD